MGMYPFTVESVKSLLTDFVIAMSIKAKYSKVPLEVYYIHTVILNIVGGRF
jgi:hypothetical protein